MQATLAATEAMAASRLAEIRERGALRCAVFPSVPGFAAERDGRVTGFDADVCRAVAAAILGDATKVEFETVAHVAEFAKRPDVDLAVRRLTWTPAREQASGMTFGPVVFHDGQGFLVPVDGGIRGSAQLAGERVCVSSAERHPQTLRDYFRNRGQEIQLVLVDSDLAAEAALHDRRCRAWSADVSWLAAARSGFRDGTTRFEILPERISKEPLAPLMRMRDIDLHRVVQWTIHALIEAEELGIDSGNIDQVSEDPSPLRHFLGIRPDADVAPRAGTWVRAIITGVGNYGELFDRNLGTGSSIRLERGPNRLWTNGGLLYAPPLGR